MRDLDQITVLHVDDQPQFCELTKTMLERDDDRFNVLTETDPHEVAEVLDEQSVDCLVTDYEMPGIDGLELLEQVRERDPSLPVILFTGKGTEAVASRAISAGVTEYLQKESGTEQYEVLANRIRNAVERRVETQQREQYQTIVETAGDAMYVLDEDGYIEIVNEAFEQLFGYSRDEVRGEHVSTFLAAEQVERGAEAIQSLLRNDDRESERFTFRAQSPDGEVRLYETTVSLITQNDTSGSVGIVRDITEERRQDELLEGLFEESLHGIGVKEIITDESGDPIDYIYKRVNDQFEELTGLDADDVVGKRATEVIDGIEDTPFIEIFGEVALEDTTAQFEQYSEPLERYYEVSAFSPRHGECISLFSDITERKEREQELERYGALIEHSSDLLIVIDETGTVTYQSSTTDEYTGFKPQQLLGESAKEYIHPEDSASLQNDFNRLLQHPDEVVVSEYRAQTRDGQWRWFENRAQNELDNPQIEGIIVSVRDITERKEREQQLARYTETLEQLQQSTQTLIEDTDAEEAASHAVNAFEQVFEYDTVGLWLSTPDRDMLEPVAVSDRGTEIISDPPTYSAETQSISWDAYQKQELRYIRDMSEHEERANPEIPIQSEVIAPLGRYGLVNIGSTEVDAFTEQDVSLIELWADTLAVVFAQITQFELLQEREQQLKRTRDLLNHTQELAEVGGWEIDVDTGEQVWTEGTYAIHDLDPDGEFTPTVESGIEFYHPDDRDQIERLVTQCMENGDPYETELRLRTAEDRLRWVRTSGEPIRDGESIQSVRGAIQDITEQQNYERTLHQLVQKTDELIDAKNKAHIAEIAVDISCNIINTPLAGVHLLSEDGKRLEGIAANNDLTDELEGQPVYTRTESNAVSELVFETFDHGEPLYIKDTESYGTLAEETPVKSGIIHPLADHGVLILSTTVSDAFSETDRNLIELVAQSVTAALDRVERENELRANESRLQRERDRLDEFVSVVSHDLQNPLNVAAARAELATQECDSDHLEDVTWALSRMESLIEDLLILSRQGKTVGETEEIVLENIVSSCWRTVESDNATITIETEATLTADRSRVRQALENLFSNAIEHGGESVTVTVGVIDNEDGFYVSDDGPGIPAEDRRDVFDSGFSTNEDGTGFGLAIVKRVCEAHGWEVSVTESEMGGARFEITGIDSLDP